MPPAATMGDSVMGACAHIWQSTTPTPVGPVPSPVPDPTPFSGKITVGCCMTVLIGNKPAAVMGATVINTAIHLPMGGAATPGPSVPPPTNQATIIKGSATVLIGGQPAARLGDTAQGTGCLLAPGTVIGTAATVEIGG